MKEERRTKMNIVKNNSNKNENEDIYKCIKYTLTVNNQ